MREGTEPLSAEGGWRNDWGLPVPPSPGSGAPRAGPERSPGSRAPARPLGSDGGPNVTSALGTDPVAAEETEVPVPGECLRRRCQRHRSARPGFIWPAATMSVPSALMKQPPIQSTAGAVPVRNEKGKPGARGSAGWLDGRGAGIGAGAAGARDSR